ncbi:HNH endonuclease, partial [Streptomyces erythrochromogenes]
MAVSKRLRYEILRRDNHTCRYCGAAAPDAPLRIDHVTPVALGGTDTADNLVTACEPCNSGKTSTTTDAATVADVKQDALRWAEAMKQAAANLTAADRHKAAYRDAFLAEWNRWGAGKGKQRREIDLPKD